MNKLTACTSLGAVALTLGLNTGCNVDERVAEAAVSTALAAFESADLGRTAFEHGRNGAACLDAASISSEMSEIAPIGLYPEGCAEKTLSDTTVHLEMDACTGPYGHADYSGGIDTRYETPTCDTLEVSIADSGNLTNHGNPLLHDATASVTLGDDVHFADYSGHWKGQTKRGVDVETDLALELEVDAVQECLVRGDGLAWGEAAGYRIELEMDGFAGCRGSCPSGGTFDATVEGPVRTWGLKATFDGSNVVTVEADNGEVFEVPIDCEPVL